MRWQVQEAKQRFSEVVRAAAAGEPQIVTRHGEEIVVVIDIEEYRRWHGNGAGLMRYLRAEPFMDADLEVERDQAPHRDVDLPD
jgi:prevent-host-death family protein